MNYIFLGGYFYLQYAYIDNDDYLADSLFYKHEVPVRFGDEYRCETEKYCVIFCKIRKKYKKKFEKALLELHNKMLICGHTDYPKFCEKFMQNLKKAGLKND